MPSRNSIKKYKENSFYHVYNRGVAKQDIFLEDYDKKYMLKLIGTAFERSEISSGLEINAFCLMDNHVHFLLYQKNIEAMTKLMSSIMTSYSMYFNKKYDRVGHLFQGRYKASLIDNEAYLLHITRYIHLNPTNFEDYEFSSYKDYVLSIRPGSSFLSERRVLELFDRSKTEYKLFVSDYIGNELSTENLEEILA